jgi:hypothetical protein
MNKNFRLLLTAVGAAALVFAMELCAAEPESVQHPDYLKMVKAYADAMIKAGRDTYGEEHSPLFASALDRKSMKIGPMPAISGVRNGDRSLGGANPQTEYGLYSVLYELTRLTGESVYATEADNALKYFFTHCQSPKTDLMAWGEHIYWDFNREGVNGNDSCHEVCGEWPFWDQCYRLAPDACWQFAIGQWDHQIKSKETGEFSRHARWSSHGPGSGADFPRYAGQLIVNWADAYTRKENAGRERKEEMITAITCLVRRMEENMAQTKTGYLPALRGADYAWSDSNLELARCLWKAAPRLNQELAQRMTKLALKQDEDFHRMPHMITSNGGFAATLHTETGVPRDRSMNKPYTAIWATGYGHGTHAGRANRCYARYEQIQKEHQELASKYKCLILAAADQYLEADPDTKQLLKPDALAEAIGLMLNAHEISGEKKYLNRADHFGQLGIKLFLDDGLPLPKATNRHDHYEAITDGPSFMSALLDLHQRLK